MPIADFIMAGVMYLVSGVMFWQMQYIKAADSRLFPTAIAILLILLATGLVVMRIINKDKTRYDFSNSLRGFKLMGILLVFVLCTKWFGFFSCVPFFLFAAMYFLGQRNKILLVAVPVVMTVVIIVLFDVLFKVQIPQGALFDPYALIFK